MGGGAIVAFNKKEKIKKVKEISTNDAGVLTQRSKSEKVLFGVVFVIFAIYSTSLIYPIVWMLINSFQDPLDYFNKLAVGGNPFELPKTWHFDNYDYAISRMYAIASTGRKIYVYEMMFNSIWYVGLQVPLVVWYAIYGYVLSKYKFKGGGLIHGFIIFTMVFQIEGSGGAALKLDQLLGLYNNPLRMFWGYLGISFGFSTLIMIGFYSKVSWHYAEAVFMDGGGHFTAFFKVMLPQAKPMLITFGMLTFISSWNDYMTPLVYLPDYPTLASGLYRIQTSFSRTGNMPAYFAGLIVITMPVIVLFCCASNKIMENFSIGGLKG